MLSSVIINSLLYSATTGRGIPQRCLSPPPPLAYSPPSLLVSSHHGWHHLLRAIPPSPPPVLPCPLPLATPSGNWVLPTQPGRPLPSPLSPPPPSCPAACIQLAALAAACCSAGPVGECYHSCASGPRVLLRVVVCSIALQVHELMRGDARLCSGAQACAALPHGKRLPFQFLLHQAVRRRAPSPFPPSFLALSVPLQRQCTAASPPDEATWAGCRYCTCACGTRWVAVHSTALLDYGITPRHGASAWYRQGCPPPWCTPADVVGTNRRSVPHLPPAPHPLRVASAYGTALPLHVLCPGAVRASPPPSPVVLHMLNPAVRVPLHWASSAGAL